jgi:hypothetical protein
VVPAWVIASCRSQGTAAVVVAGLGDYRRTYHWALLDGVDGATVTAAIFPRVCDARYAIASRWREKVFLPEGHKATAVAVRKPVAVRPKTLILRTFPWRTW